MHGARWLIGTLMIVGAFAFATSAGANETVVRPNLVEVTGTVRHYAFEGGFWAVRGDDGKTYDPLGGLPPSFQREGLRVRLKGKLRTDVGSVHMVGPVVEVVSIEPM